MHDVNQCSLIYHCGTIKACGGTGIVPLSYTVIVRINVPPSYTNIAMFSAPSSYTILVVFSRLVIPTRPDVAGCTSIDWFWGESGGIAVDEDGVLFG